MPLFQAWHGGAMGRADRVFAGCRWLYQGLLHHRAETVWPKSRFTWRWGWLCLCGPVTWDEAFMPDAGMVSLADHGTVI